MVFGNLQKWPWPEGLGLFPAPLGRRSTIAIAPICSFVGARCRWTAIANSDMNPQLNYVMYGHTQSVTCNTGHHRKTDNTKTSFEVRCQIDGVLLNKDEECERRSTHFKTLNGFLLYFIARCHLGVALLFAPVGPELNNKWMYSLLPGFRTTGCGNANNNVSLKWIGALRELSL